MAPRALSPVFGTSRNSPRLPFEPAAENRPRRSIPFTSFTPGPASGPSKTGRTRTSTSGSVGRSVEKTKVGTVGSLAGRGDGRSLPAAPRGNTGARWVRWAAVDAKDLRDLVRFDEDGPHHEDLFESEHLWSEVVCLDRNQALGTIADRGLGRPRPGRDRSGRGPGEPRAQAPGAVGDNARARRVRAHRHERDRGSRRGPARRLAAASEARRQRVGVRRGRSRLRPKATAKLGTLAPRPESNSGKGNPTPSNSPPTASTHPCGPVGTHQW